MIHTQEFSQLQLRGIQFRCCHFNKHNSTIILLVIKVSLFCRHCSGDSIQYSENSESFGAIWKQFWWEPDTSEIAFSLLVINGFTATVGSFRFRYSGRRPAVFRNLRVCVHRFDARARRFGRQMSELGCRKLDNNGISACYYVQVVDQIELDIVVKQASGSRSVEVTMLNSQWKKGNWKVTKLGVSHSARRNARCLWWYVKWQKEKVPRANLLTTNCH